MSIFSRRIHVRTDIAAPLLRDAERAYKAMNEALRSRAESTKL